jgi:HD-like signal output (HDOD) protein
MGDALQQWVERLTAQPLPIWRDSRAKLSALATGGRYNAHALVQNLAHDPLLAAQLLRQANSGRRDGTITTIQQAAVMLGAHYLRTLAADLPVLEDQLDKQEQAALRRLQRYAFHVGYLARELVRRFKDPHYDQAFYAGLLHNLGELVLRALSPELLPQIHQLAVKQRISLSAAATDVVGFEIPALSAALAQRWQLPGLIRGVLDSQHSQDRRCELVVLSAAILHQGPQALARADGAPLVRAASVLRERPEALRTIVFRSATEAAAHLSQRLSASLGESGELFPEEPQDSHEDVEPAAAPECPESLQRLDLLFEHGRVGAQQALDEFIAALHDGLGLDRVVVALLAADHASLRGRFFRGVAPGSPLHRFEFHRGDGSVFSRLLERPAAVWVQPAALLTPAVQRVVDASEFIAQSVFVRDRPVALVYADRAISRRAITGDTYEQFRHRCRQLVVHLGRLSPR